MATHNFFRYMRRLTVALILFSSAYTSHSQSNPVYCDHFIAQEFHKQNGGAFLVPEKFYKKENPGDCPKYLGRACGQFIIPFDQMKSIVGKRMEVSTDEMNTALGTNLKPGTYILVWVDTDRPELKVRCPRFAELHKAAEKSACPTHDDCGCIPGKFIDGAGKTSGGMTEGFVNGVLRSQSYWQEKGIVILN